MLVIAPLSAIIWQRGHSTAASSRAVSALNPRLTGCEVSRLVMQGGGEDGSQVRAVEPHGLPGGQTEVVQRRPQAAARRRANCGVTHEAVLALRLASAVVLRPCMALGGYYMMP